MRIKNFFKPTLLLLALSAVVLAGCGDNSNGLESENEAFPVDLGGLTYQVQISRQLNVMDVEDRTYVKGLTPQQLKLNPDETFFAVFITVKNFKDKGALPSAEAFEVTDTQHAHYKPIALPATNEFAYVPGMVAAGQELPAKESIPQFGPAGGLVLLYKVKLESFDNRPLMLEIKQNEFSKQTAEIRLDL